MRILHIVAGGSQGGAETYCLDAIKALNDKGLEQQVLCRSGKTYLDALNDRNIKYRTLSFNRFRKKREQSVIRKTIKDYKPDIIHCWMRRASSFMPSGIDIPVLGWFGGYYDLKYYNNCDFYMGVTKQTVRHIITQSGKPHRAFLVHTFGTLEENKPLTKADFDIPENAKTALLLSRMHPVKGIDTLLEAAKKLKDVFFILAGNGPDSEKYQEMSEKYGLTDRVRFVGWRDDRGALLELADVCVLPSRQESFGTVIPESWSSNIPIVATKADGARQYVTHNKDGLLCEIDDAEQLAQNIHTALNDNEIRETLIAGGRESYENNFSREVVVKILSEAYETILQTGKPKKRLLKAQQFTISQVLRKEIEDAVLAAGAGTIIGQDVLSVAAAYLYEYDDSSIATDAAILQATKRYNFIKGVFRKRVEMLSEAELNTLLINQQYMGNNLK